jgi:hypothetical protein
MSEGSISNTANTIAALSTRSRKRTRSGRLGEFPEPIKEGIAAPGGDADLRRWRSPAGRCITPFDEITSPQLPGNMRVAQPIMELGIAPTEISKCGSEEPMH